MSNPTEQREGAAAMNRTRSNPSRILLSALAAFGVTALSTQADIILPTAGNSVTFEAEAYDAQSGTSIAADATNASGGSFVDGLAASAAGGGNGDFIRFNISNLDTALIYDITLHYRRAQDGDAVFEYYGVTSGPTYSLLASINAPRTSQTWTGPFFEGLTSSGFSIAAGTTAIQVESLSNGAHLDSFTITASAPIPEPSVLALLAARVRRFRANAA